MRVAFANTHLLYCAARDPALARDLRGFCVVNDGVGVDILSRLATGERFPDNLNGTDLTPKILGALPVGTRVFMLGAAPDVVEKAALAIAERWPQLRICGIRDGYAGKDDAIEHIVTSHPDIVLVAMGNPMQERLIADCSQRTGGVFIGVGALFDFIAGAVPRAPESWRRLRLEWLFRLKCEPRRLWRRYTIEVLVLAALVCRERLLRRA
ncbi:MAG: WecB/TagA/CpsF family glycosyltransferase [Phycisphaerales bacterium]|nr:WecB/TagA/CpsF family glycosyltransferase [Hyphomonadaceae bacterium]